MYLVGIIFGEVEGHKWAKVQLTQPCDLTRGVGKSCVSSKIVYDLANEIKEDWVMYENQKVNVYYDRFGRVNRIELDG